MSRCAAKVVDGGWMMNSRVAAIVRPFAVAIAVAFSAGSAGAQGPGGGAPPPATQEIFTQPIGQQILPPSCLMLRPLGGYTPCSPQNYTQWLESIVHWRMEQRIRIGYDPARYENPALKWAQSAFMQPQMMVHDRYFYDPVAGKYTVDRYLDDLDKRYGR